MKKSLGFIFAVLVLTSMLVAATAESVTHLLWDIPFETSWIDCKKLVYEKAGIELPSEMLLFAVLSTANVKADQSITMFGHPVKLEASFTKDGTRIRWWEIELIDFYEGESSSASCFFDSDFADPEERRSVIASSLTAYEDVMSGIRAKYGNETYGYLWVYGVGDYESMWFNYPILDGTLNIELVMQALEIGGYQIFIEAAVGNIVVELKWYEKNPDVSAADKAKARITIRFYEPVEFASTVSRTGLEKKGGDLYVFLNPEPEDKAPIEIGF